MGITGLWDAIQAAGESKSLCKFASAQTHALREQRDRRLVRIGVDLSPLMAECVAAASAPTVHGRFLGSEIYILFTKLVKFLHVPAVFVFVLDGAKRPGVKRGTQVVHREVHWKKWAERLIECCGYYLHQAPGEAEAELAALNINGCVDAVISTDSDTVVFGAHTILKSVPKASRLFDDQYLVFTAENIERTMHLTRGGAILFALLAGGDYGAGLDGFGRSTALVLAQAGFGDSLLNAVDTLTGAQLSEFLAEWRQLIRTELLENPSGRFTRCPPSHIALLVDETFPDHTILDLYYHPVVTAALGTHRHTWIHQEPNITAIAKFCSEIFDWNTPSLINTKLASCFWGPMFLQLLYSTYRVYDPDRKLLVTPFNNAEVLDFKYVMRKGKHAHASEDKPEARLTISTMTFLGSLGKDFKVDMGDATTSVTVYAPKVMIPATMKTAHFLKSTVRAKKAKSVSARSMKGARKTLNSKTKTVSSSGSYPRNGTPGPSNHATSSASYPQNATPGPSNHSAVGNYGALEKRTSSESISDENEFPTIREMVEQSKGKSSATHKHLGTIDLTVSEDDEVEEPLPTTTSTTEHHHNDYIDLTQSDEDRM